MPDVIQLLPDSIANQIAAGEVVQRPASAVKELLENALDAGGTRVQLILKDAGKTLIQVIDNGCGMSETDARMCFERHATSKIRKAKDLFAIRTMGFRGEALASIAAIAQVELRTRRQIDDLGTRVVVEGSMVKTQEPCQCAAGTSFSIKNLFYNVPARRNFLKSDTVEMRHIVDEFLRIAIANPDVFFSLHHNDQEQYHLQPGTLRQRIVAAYGQDTNKKLVPLLEQETDVVRMSGFIGKPEFAKKTRGEQLLYVNKRFIKSDFMHRAILSAYENAIKPDHTPLYVVFFDLDPARVDINVHPTKQEIKFDDERAIYEFLKVAIRHSLGKQSITPSLDFDQDSIFAPSYTKVTKDDIPALETHISPKRKRQNTTTPDKKPNTAEQFQALEGLYKSMELFDEEEINGKPPDDISVTTIESKMSSGDAKLDDANQSFSKSQRLPYQVHSRYIVNHVKSGFILMDQQAAHERILFERYVEMLSGKAPATQQQLFHKQIELSPADALVLKDILPQLAQLGFDIREFGGNDFVIQGIPADMGGSFDEQKTIEEFIEQVKNDETFAYDAPERIAKAMARSAAVKRGQNLTIAEMQNLIDRLFACAMPYTSPAGHKTFVTFGLEELENKFK